MKTKVFYLATKVTVAVVLVALLASKAVAVGTPKLKFETYSVENAVITIENIDDNAILTIENSRGSIVYYTEGNIKDKSYSKMFNFKNLSNGNYVATVKTSNGEHTVNFAVKGSEIKLVETLSAPFFKIEKDMLKLSYLNGNQEPVGITLIKNDDEVYNKYLGSNFSINAGFNIARLKEGEYKVILSNGDNTFSYNFKK